MQKGSVYKQILLNGIIYGRPVIKCHYFMEGHHLLKRSRGTGAALIFPDAS